jgi:hypothetical protein
MDVGLAFTSLEKQEDGPPSTIKKIKLNTPQPFCLCFHSPPAEKQNSKKYQHECISLYFSSFCGYYFKIINFKKLLIIIFLKLKFLSQFKIKNMFK